MALAVLPLTSATIVPKALQQRSVHETCEFTHVRKPWDQLTTTEKSDYVNATKCLVNATPQLDIEGAQNRWDEFQHAHIAQVSWIHFVGAFLPWHRYYLHVHEQALKDKCGYTGAMPYWNEPYGAANGVSNSTVFQDDSMGGNGVGDNGSVKSGPFANTTLHLKDGDVDDYCLSREFNQDGFDGSNYTEIATCQAKTTFVDMWDCIEQSPHRSGHSFSGGTMIDVAASPGDIVFFLHYGFVDALWARWQAVDPSNRMYWIGGNNVQDNFDGSEAQYLAFTEYNGDSGNVTTLNHPCDVLWVAGLAANITACDNISSATNCVEYVFPDDW